jgi:uncharacterized protein (TIGR03435 family)
MKYFLVLGFCTACFAQTAPALPQFEVASVRPSGPTAPEAMKLGVHIDGARMSCNYFSLTDLIRFAYQVKQYQVTGPDWLASDRFDIAATLPAGSKQDQTRDMMKALLLDRFQLKVHTEKKDFPVYALTVAKSGLKMKESAPDVDDATGTDPKDAPKAPARAPVNVSASGGRGGVNINYGNGSYFTFGDNKLVVRKLTTAQFCEMLARFEDRPVVDMTGLTAKYDLDLQFTEDDYRAMLIRSAVSAGVSLPPEALRMMEGASGDSLLAALEKIGLKLETRKAPLDVLVVDHMSRTPTEN